MLLRLLISSRAKYGLVGFLDCWRMQTDMISNRNTALAHSAFSRGCRPSAVIIMHAAALAPPSS